MGRMRGRLGRGGEEGEQRGELRRGEGSSGAQLCIAQMVFFLAQLRGWKVSQLHNRLSHTHNCALHGGFCTVIFLHSGLHIIE